ncbi:hypothetical protein [Paraburkholderia adhaesiva]|uniref:hypothetical protein n=1 Tax=Paraburkholderia adhaesiva TaxID=2883244 RepID=UPI001F2D8875|nr:hypothetical protein [Paraburkholderia adhaesiva]
MEMFTIYIRRPDGRVLEFHVKADDALEATFTALERFQLFFVDTPARVRQTPFTDEMPKWLH